MKILTLILGIAFGRWQKGWEVSASDLKERVDETCKLVDTIAQDAAAYWDRDRISDDPGVERRLIAQLRRLETLRLHCAEDGPAFSDRTTVVDVLDDYFEAVSGGNFQGAARAAEPRRSDRVHEIATKLTIGLRNARRIERRRIVPPWLSKKFKRHS